MIQIRKMMWANALLSAVFMTLLSFTTACSSDNDEPEIQTDETVAGEVGRTLIVYFSWGGNTQTVANEVHNLIGGDIVEVETVEPYPDSYEELRPIAYEELDNGGRELKTVVENMDEYDTLIVGSPIWGGRLTPPMKRFLESYDLSGKTIAPFTTHQGSGLGQSVADIRSVCPNSTIVTGLAINATQAGSSRDVVDSWLRQIGILE